jgi:hypothetical protein
MSPEPKNSGHNFRSERWPSLEAILAVSRMSASALFLRPILAVPVLVLIG